MSVWFVLQIGDLEHLLHNNREICLQRPELFKMMRCVDHGKYINDPDHFEHHVHCHMNTWVSYLGWNLLVDVGMYRKCWHPLSLFVCSF